MRTRPRVILTAILLGAMCWPASAQEKVNDQPAKKGAKTTPAEPLPEEYSCMFCHGPSGTLADSPDNKHLIVTEKDLAGDIHWQKGLRCHDCHGGDPVLENYTNHRDDPDFLSRMVSSGADIPRFCGRCHSDLVYMRRYSPSARTDQEAEYWTSGHGKRLRKAMDDHEKALENVKEGETPPVMEDPPVATCVSCHGKHNILAVHDQSSPVYTTNVAPTCAKCHSDPDLMAGITFNGRPLGHNQYLLWEKSVHGEALLEKNDLSAPTCNDCHGNHGAMPPGVDSVANACGTCHGKVASLFAETRMKHKFEEVGLPGCATCHGNHQTVHPTDDMLGMGTGSVCTGCHVDQKYGATLAGAKTASEMRDGLEELKREIREAEEKVAQAERLGMEISGPRFDLRQAFDALTNARTAVHTFAPGPVKDALEEGKQITSSVKASADAALADHTARRVWLAAFLLPVLVVVSLLLRYIRSLPLPAAERVPSSS